MSVYVISDVIGKAVASKSVPELEQGQQVVSPREGLPDAAALADATFILVIGPTESADAAVQLGGAVRLAVERGTVAVIAYEVRLEGADLQLVRRLVNLQTADSNIAGSVKAVHPAFRDYLTAYSQGATVFDGLPDDAEELAAVHLADREGTAGFAVRIGEGAVYVLPYHRREALPAVLKEVFRAVNAHREGGEAVPPPFLDGLRLPGEEDIRADIDELASKLETKQAELQGLSRFKDLVGYATGGRFEDLCIDSLGRVFGDSKYRAEDREEKFEEDFWIVEGGEDLALAEAKGINSGVGREHINKVDDHREALELPHGFPGLLVVNVARKSPELGLRQADLHPAIVTHASRQNVLVCRAWDLFCLVSIALSGDDAATPFIKALRAGGGWYEVAANGQTTHHAT